MHLSVCEPAYVYTRRRSESRSPCGIYHNPLLRPPGTAPGMQKFAVALGLSICTAFAGQMAFSSRGRPPKSWPQQAGHEAGVKDASRSFGDSGPQLVDGRTLIGMRTLPSLEGMSWRLKHELKD